MALKRDPNLGDFVLEILVDAGDLERQRHLKQYDRLWGFTHVWEKSDNDLARPHESAMQRAKSMANTVPILIEELNAIETHVEALYKPWKDIRRDLVDLGQGSPFESRGQTKLNKKRERLFELMKSFAEDIPSVIVTQNTQEIKASYAYKIASTYGFSMAFGELCAIKARAKGQGPITQEILETMRIPASSLRALAQNTEF
jgi:RNA-dependent RNA polymerase